MIYFTTNEANQVLPEVIKKFEMALAKKNEVVKLEQQLQMVMSTTNKFEDYVPLKQKLNSAITQFYEASENLEKTGVVTRVLSKDCLIFPQNALMRMYGYAGSTGKQKLNFGMIKKRGLWEENP